MKTYGCSIAHTVEKEKRIKHIILWVISLIWSKTQILSELQEIIYEIHLKFAKELISELRLNEKKPRKKVFFFTFNRSQGGWIIFIEISHLCVKFWEKKEVPRETWLNLAGNGQCKDSNKHNFSVLSCV